MFSTVIDYHSDTAWAFICIIVGLSLSLGVLGLGFTI